MLTKSEESNLSGGLGRGHDPIVIPRASIISGGALSPLVLRECVMNDDVERGQRAEQQRERQRGSKWNQDRAHRDERDAVLQ